MGEYDEEHPIASTAAKIGGAVAGTVTGARALSATGATKALPKALTTVAPTARGRAAQMVAGGAVGGAVEGFNSGEGGVWSRAETAGVKDILGPDSPEWGAVRRAAWDHVTTATEGRQPYGPQRIVSNISELLDGKGKTLGRELFTEQELRVMAEFRDMMKVLIPPAKATNPSGSGYEMQRFAQQMMQSMAGLAGGAAGGPFAGMATSGAVNASGNFSGAVAARAATKGIVPGPPSIPASVGAGVGAAASAQDQVGR
ncbi:hypothetical protein KUV28_11960 [Ferrimonas balearica]|nr:hypothetical protein [Ferrimonas balearica]